jgi:hypothetical protein
VQPFAFLAAKPPEANDMPSTFRVNQVAVAPVVRFQFSVALRARDGFGPRHNKHRRWLSRLASYRDTMTRCVFSASGYPARGFSLLRTLFRPSYSATLGQATSVAPRHSGRAQAASLSPMEIRVTVLLKVVFVGLDLHELL